MYLQHFGLQEPPFSLTPDPGFFYRYAGHQEALNVLLVAMEAGEGFIKITGEVGTGKTLLCRKLLNALGERTWTAYIPNPLLNPFELHKALAEELSLEIPPQATMHDLVKRITAALIQLHKQGHRAVLCIDEAQGLSRESLEALRLLSNLETAKNKLLQIVVFAQPELDQLLQRPDLRQLRQRITFSYRLPPLDRPGVAGYLNHRLQVAGREGADLFSPQAVNLLFRGSRGIPRLVNILGHKALMATYGRGLTVVGPRQVREACQDTEDVEASQLRRYGQPLHWVLGLVSLLEMAALAYLLKRVFL